MSNTHKKLYSNVGLTKQQIEIRDLAMVDPKAFVALVAPQRVLGHCHFELLDFFNNEEQLFQLALWPRGHGKAQPLDEKVLTPTGWKTIGDLSVGDFVVGSNGNPVRVTHLHPISEMGIYEITTRDGRKSRCNEEHLWRVECPSNKKGFQILPLKTIMENYKSSRFDKRNSTEYTEYRYFIEPIQVKFSEKELLIDPYVLGVWLGDGTSASGQVTTADPEIFDRFDAYTISKNKAKYRYGILGLYAKLRKLDLINNKHIPQEYLESSIEQRTALLQGIVDTDGYIQKDGKRFSITTIKEQLKDDYVALIRSLGGTATVGDAWTKCNGKMHHSFCITARVPANIIPASMHRKVDRWQGSIKTKSAITNIEYVGIKEARCITVENSNGIYITSDYLPTHNSTLIAYFTALEVIRKPDITILYASDTATLAEFQLTAIKQILTSDVVQRYWPGLINVEEGKRTMWRNNAIAVDHWKRQQEFVRDPTIFSAGMGANITGTHFDLIILDDIVVYDNSATPEERMKCRTWYSLLSSILNPGGKIKAVGTRYHPQDLYNSMMRMTEDILDKDGNVVEEQKIYTISERIVEDDGQFLWPKQQRKDGRWFGFDKVELNKKRAQYLDKAQFYAQYYNDPTDPEQKLQYEFQYYEKGKLHYQNDRWYYGDQCLNVYAGIDFASTITKKADYTAIVVLGVDPNHNMYVLDIDRFKTDRISVMQEHLNKLYNKWRWIKLKAEATAAQNLVVNQIKDSNRKNGIFYTIESFKPCTDKLTRIKSNLEPRYAAQALFHYRGGNCQILEDELISDRPAHDDVKDCLASVVEIAIAPSARLATNRRNVSNLSFHPKWGGVV